MYLFRSLSYDIILMGCLYLGFRALFTLTEKQKRLSQKGDLLTIKYAYFLCVSPLISVNLCVILKAPKALSSPKDLICPNILSFSKKANNHHCKQKNCPEITFQTASFVFHFIENFILQSMPCQLAELIEN